MKIRITKEIESVNERYRPVVGEVYTARKCNDPRGVRYDIEVNGRHTLVFPYECEVVR